VLLLATILSLASAGDDPEVLFNGMLQSDLRFRLGEDPKSAWYAPVEGQPRIVRNQNLFKTKIKAKAGNFRGVVDADLVFEGFPQSGVTLDQADQRQLVDPFFFQAHDMYIEGRDLLTKGLDLRLGQQRVMWGVGDQFNPTNTINPDDVEDVLLFGDQMGNIMARLDYAPVSAFTLTGVLVPVFKPALLPSSAPYGLTNPAQLPFLEEDLRWRIHSEGALADEFFGYPTVIDQVVFDYPDATPKNMQYAFRLGTFIGMQDLSVSYYNGFSDIPQPVATHTTQTSLTTENEEGESVPLCDERHPKDCIQGTLNNITTLSFPRIQVVGFNWAGEMNPLGWIHQSIQSIGFRIEAALVFPERTDITLTQGPVEFGLLASQPAGEYEYELGKGKKPTIVDDRPYPQWVVGLDYTVGRHVYLNGQWVHGMLDEVGAGDNLFQEGYAVRNGGVDSEIGDTTGCALDRDGRKCAYEVLRSRQSDLAVIGVDINFLSNAALLRLFTIWDLTGLKEEHFVKGERVMTSHGAFTKEGQSAVIYPEFAYNFGNGLQLGGGALIQMGSEDTKFGAPAAGGNLVFTRGKFSF
jgi:hypothetical protein